MMLTFTLEILKTLIVGILGGVVGVFLFERIRFKQEGSWWEAKERWKFKIEIYPKLLAFHEHVAPLMVRTWNDFPDATSRAAAFRSALQSLRTADYLIAREKSAVLLSRGILNQFRRLDSFFELLGQDDYWEDGEELKSRAQTPRAVYELLLRQAEFDLELREPKRLSTRSLLRLRLGAKE